MDCSGLLLLEEEEEEEEEEQEAETLKWCHVDWQAEFQESRNGMPTMVLMSGRAAELSEQRAQAFVARSSRVWVVKDCLM